MENLPDNKQTMLAQIRSALGRETATAAPEGLAPFQLPSVEADAEGLVMQFAHELEKVGGRVVRLGSDEEVRAYLEALLSETVDAAVALSDADALRRLGLHEWLIESGRAVVPSLREFIEAEIRSDAALDEATKAEGQQVAVLVDKYKGLLLEAGIGITSADFALAATGTLVIVSGDEQHRLISLLPPVHVCLLDPSRILPTLSELLTHVYDTNGQHGGATPPHSMICITGPSRTADIEQTITLGVHGPKTLQVVLYSPAK